MEQNLLLALRVNKHSNSSKPLLQQSQSNRKSVTYFPKLSVYHHEDSSIMHTKPLVPIKIVKLVDKKPKPQKSKISRFNSILVSGSHLHLRARFFTPEPSKKPSYIAKIPYIKPDHHL